MADASHPLDTRASLLVRVRDPGDAEAWGQFTAVYTPLVYRHCYRAGLQPADAADVAQEVFLEVARAVAGFEYRPERGRFRDWLGTVVRRKLGRFRARAARTADPVDATDLDRHEAPPAGWAEEFDAHVLAVAADRVRSEFTPAHWRAFELVWWGGRSAPEAAAAAGLTVTAVYVAKSRILTRLRDEVLRLAGDAPGLVPLT